MVRKLESTPRQDGFYMPAEWEPHSQTWMLWPERRDNWRLAAEPAQRAFSDVATAIYRFEALTMGVNHSQFQNALGILPARVHVVELPCNDAWMRDCGPTFLIDGRGELRLVDWRFNAWGGLQGGLYSLWDLDEQVAGKVAAMEGVDYYRAPLVLEGGSIHVDGEGTLLTTEECLLNSNRNPELSKEEIEQYLKDYTGATKILWLPAGVYNDETNGHIDNLACFLYPGMVALTWTEDHNDPQYPISKDALDRLRKVMDAKGRDLEVLKIHQPDPVLINIDEASGIEANSGTKPRQAGDRMAASYINFYYCNGAAVVPSFEDPHDALALSILKKVLPKRNVIAVPTREILLGGGNIHCITQQQPAV
jgi:agmatine deiminase